MNLNKQKIINYYKEKIKNYKLDTSSHYDFDDSLDTINWYKKRLEYWEKKLT